MSLQCVFHNIVVCALFVLQVLLVSHLFQSSICLGFVWERGKELSFTEKKKKRFHRAFCVTHTDWWIVSQSTAAAADRFLNNIDRDNDNLCTTAVKKYSPIYVS